MAYLYRHIRLDKNEPFYIGIGEDKPNHQNQYKRAYNKKGVSSYKQINIYQFDKLGNFVKEWNSITEAVNNGFKGVNNVLAGRYLKHQKDIFLNIKNNVNKNKTFKI